MTSEQKSLVQSTFNEVLPIADKAAAMFYARLFEIDPSLKPLFKTDLKEQGEKLMQTLHVAVKGLDKLDELIPALEALGKRHKTYGVKNEHYATVAQALLWTLEKGLGEKYTKDVAAAWTSVYTIVADVMTKAASKN